jgi:hypothetical protein
VCILKINQCNPSSLNHHDGGISAHHSKAAPDQLRNRFIGMRHIGASRRRPCVGGDPAHSASVALDGLERLDQ